MYFFLLAYAILGGGIKYIDAAYDEKTFNKKVALVFAPLLGALWAYTMLIDPYSASILLAILLGVLMKGKIDNPAHLLGFFIILAIVVLAQVQLVILPLIILAVAALLDEIGNDIIDNKKESFSKSRFLHQFTIAFFEQRWVLKIVLLGIAIAGIIPIYFFLAMLLFDYAYFMIRLYSQSKQKTSETEVHPNLQLGRLSRSKPKRSADIAED